MLPVVKLLIVWILGIIFLPYIEVSMALVIGLTVLCSYFFWCLHFLPARSFKHIENALIVLVICVVMVLDYNCCQRKGLCVCIIIKHIRFLMRLECHKQTNNQYTYIVRLHAVVKDSIYRLEEVCLLFQNRAIYSKYFYPSDRFYASV